MRRILFVALLAACDRDEAPPARAPEPVREIEPAKVFPGLEPFVDSRMWPIVGQGQMHITQVISELEKVEQRIDHPPQMDGLPPEEPPAEEELLPEGEPDARLKPLMPGKLRFASIVPFMMAELKPLWGRDNWSKHEIQLAREVTRLCKRLGAPELLFGDDPEANQRSLALLAGWFRDYVSMPAGMGSMIFTMDYGPFGGLPVAEDAEVEIKDRKPFGEFEFQLCRMKGEAKEPWVLRAVKGESVMWSRVASGAPDGSIPDVSLGGKDPTELGPYGWKLHLYAGGEYMQLYVARDGSFLFYFYSW